MYSFHFFNLKELSIQLAPVHCGVGGKRVPPMTTILVPCPKLDNLWAWEIIKMDLQGNQFSCCVWNGGTKMKCGIIKKITSLPLHVILSGSCTPARGPPLIRKRTPWSSLTQHNGGFHPQRMCLKMGFMTLEPVYSSKYWITSGYFCLWKRGEGCPNV